MNPKIKDMGKVVLTPKGEYNPEVPYEFLDLVVINPTGGCYIAKRDTPAGKIYKIVEGEIVYVDDLDKYWVCVFDLRNGVSGEVLIDNTVDNSKLKDLTIQGGINGKIAIKTITGGENGNIAEKTITEFNLNDDSVITRTIKNLNVTREKINNKSITGGVEGNNSKIDDETITDVNLANNSVTTRIIKNLNVTRDKIDNRAVNTAKIELDSVTGASSEGQGNIAKDTIHLYNINSDINNGNKEEISSWFVTT